MVYRELINFFFTNLQSLPRLAGTSLSLLRSSEKAFFYPLRIQIENSTVCNLSCRMCPLNGFKRKKGFMDSGHFKKIYEALKPPFLNLTGYGESFLNKDIFKMVFYAKKNGSYVKFDTNGTLLTKENITKVLDSGLDLLSISLDGATKKTYEKIRTGGRFETVVQGIKDLVLEKNKQGKKLTIHLAMVVQAGNVDELLPLIELGEQLGVDKINPTPVVEYDLVQNKRYLLGRYKKNLQKVLEEYRKNQESYRVSVDIEPMRDFLETGKGEKVCFIPWYSTYIAWNGDVYPCCYYYNGQVNFGNIFEKPFAEIWNSPAYRKFRKCLREERNSLPICRACSIDEQFVADKIKLVPFWQIFSQRNLK